MMETTEHGSGDDRALDLGRSWDGLLLVEGLMRTRGVVETDKLCDEGAELRFAEDEDVVEQLATERADEALGEGVHVWRSGRRPHHASADRLEDARETLAELRVPVADEHFGDAVHHGVPGLLRAPLVGRRVRHGGVDDNAPPQIEEEEDEDLAEGESSLRVAGSFAGTTWSFPRVARSFPRDGDASRASGRSPGGAR
jgi:hypothetical protein